MFRRMSNPNYVPPELVEKAREIDLPTYFEMFEPGQLRRLSSGVYCTNEHDSLKMSNGKWFWWSRGCQRRRICAVHLDR